jgi:predicted CxxxxCH...CXXCH cytochrome family protein
MRLVALAVLAVLAGAAACAEERPRPDGTPVGRVHPAGILDPASEAFHGREVARRGWDLRVCARCHGDDFAGGLAGASCTTCHGGEGGPGACATCHRDGPVTGAHRVHRDAGAGCAECHVVPARWDDPGHVIGDPAPAEVTFGALAGATLAPADRAGPPRFAGGRCENVYCHGDVLHAGGGLAPRPRWDEPGPAGGCDRCHAAPPPSHAQDRCESCHPAGRHLDGALQIGRAPGCGGCHGGAASAAPPADLLGQTATTAIGVGAHQAHLQAPSRLRGPIACETCHRVPAQLLDAGHLDSPPPAEVAAGLGWERGAARCATAWCHGPAAPVWTESGGASCGTCHGVPPATASHLPGMPLTACAACHPRTIDAAGAIRIFDGPTGPTSEHIDGDVDLL